MCYVYSVVFYILFIFFFKQKTAYELRISDWSSDVCSSDLAAPLPRFPGNLISAAPSNGCIRTRRIMMLKTFIWACAAASLTISGAALAHDAAKPGDAQIAHIAYTAGQIDVDAGKQALAKSTNPAVRAFAERSEEHTAELQ